MDGSLNALGEELQEPGTNACSSPTCLLPTKSRGLVSVLSTV